WPTDASTLALSVGAARALSTKVRMGQLSTNGARNRTNAAGRFTGQWPPRRAFRIPMAPLRVTLVSLLLAANTVLHVVPLLVVTLVKALLPSARLRKASNPLLTGVAESWIGVNNRLWDRFFHPPIHPPEEAAPRA